MTTNDSRHRRKARTCVSMRRTILFSAKAEAKRCGSNFSEVTDLMWAKLLADVKAARERGDPNPCKELLLNA